MDDLASTVISRELSPGEELLWSGQPRGGLYIGWENCLLIPYSLLWGGFAIFWEVTVFRRHMPLHFKLWGVPFVLFGIYIIIGRFPADAYRRRRTYYGITTDRVIILNRVWRHQVTSLALDQLTTVTLRKRPDGSGTIIFGMPSPRRVRFVRVAAHNRRPVFLRIERAAEVYEILRSIQGAVPARS